MKKKKKSSILLFVFEILPVILILMIQFATIITIGHLIIYFAEVLKTNNNLWNVVFMVGLSAIFMQSFGVDWSKITRNRNSLFEWIRK